MMIGNCWLVSQSSAQATNWQALGVKGLALAPGRLMRLKKMSAGGTDAVAQRPPPETQLLATHQSASNTSTSTPSSFNQYPK